MDRAAPLPLRVTPCDHEQAETVHRLTQAAFASYHALDPPSGAARETVEIVGEDLAAGGGALAEQDGHAVGCLRWHTNDDGDFHVRRVAVDPILQGRGIGRALMAWAEDEARRRGCPAVVVGVRVALPGNLRFYQQLRYQIIGEHSHEGYDHTTWLALRKSL